MFERGPLPRAGRTASIAAAAFLLATTAAFRCPGPEPRAAADGEGGSGTGGDAGSSVAATTSAGGGDVATTSGGEAGGGGDVTSVGSTGSGGSGATGSGGSSATGSGATGGGGSGGDDCGDVESDPDSCGECGRQCSAAGVAQRACVEGECAPICDDTHVDIGTPVDDDGCELEGRRVFVTSADYTAAELGSVEGADVICEGVSGNLGGVWKAWLSSLQPVMASPADGFNQSEVPYRLLDGTVVADDWDALLLGPLDHAIDMDENEIAGLDAMVWTGTTTVGAPTAVDCFGWSSVGTDSGTTGDSTAIGETWTEDIGNICAGIAHLYCFEQ